jgi:hypothetical protein
MENTVPLADLWFDFFVEPRVGGGEGFKLSWLFSRLQFDSDITLLENMIDRNHAPNNRSYRPCSRRVPTGLSHLCPHRSGNSCSMDPWQRVVARDWRRRWRYRPRNQCWCVRHKILQRTWRPTEFGYRRAWGGRVLSHRRKCR